MNSRFSFLHNAFALLLLASYLLGFTNYATANDIALLDLQGNPASLDTFRNDGKLTLLMVRYNGCGPCNTSEEELQQWYANQDKNSVSVLALNIDDQDKQDRVRRRLDNQNIDYPNFFADKKLLSASIIELTGKPMRAVPYWILLGPDGKFIDSHLGAEFDWDAMDEMAMALDSGLPGLQPSVPDAKDIRSDESVGHITGAMIREDMFRAEKWIPGSLEDNPDHPGILATQVRFLMLTERVPADTPLGYRFSKSAQSIMQMALNTALDADPKHRQALYLQAELYATQGDLKAAQQAVDVARQQYHSKKSWPILYIESVLLIMQNEPNKAVANLKPVLYTKPRNQEQRFMFQRSWEQVKGVAMKHPEVDPMALVREGLMVRVASSELIDEIKQRSKSKTPLMVIVNSEDRTCSYCVDLGRKIESFVRNHKGKYNFIYTSIEPWKNISYQEWAKIIPRVNGVPKAMVFARSQYMLSGNAPISEETATLYDKNYSLFLTENPGVLNYKGKTPRAKVAVARSHWAVLKRDIAAFASVRTKDNQAWGAWPDGLGASQEEVNKKALALCARHAAEKGINKPCELDKPVKK